MSFTDVSLCFKTSPHLLQVFMRMLHNRLAVELQKCFVEHETCLFSL